VASHRRHLRSAAIVLPFPHLTRVLKSNTRGVWVDKRVKAGNGIAVLRRMSDVFNFGQAFGVDI
jgi:hypothetical protein